MRPILVILTAILGVGLSPAATYAQDAKTTRIEPRQFYGATVTLEAGVRVFRPLPPTKHVIINPNKTPLHLTEKNVTSKSTSHNYFYDQRAGAVGYPSGYYGRPAYGLPITRRGRALGRFKGRGGKRMGRGGGVPVGIGR